MKINKKKVKEIDFKILDYVITMTSVLFLMVMVGVVIIENLI